MGQAALGIQWHVLAMYGPSFVTGRLMVRFGKERVAATGLALIAAGGMEADQPLGQSVAGDRLAGEDRQPTAPERAHVGEPDLYTGENWVAGAIGEGLAYGEPEIKKGLDELTVSLRLCGSCC